MRTFILVVIAVIVLTAGLGYMLGWYAISTERQEGKFVATLEVSTGAIRDTAESAEERAKKIGERVQDRIHDLKGAETIKGSITQIATADQHFTVASAAQEERVIHVEPSSHIIGTQLDGLRVGDRVTVAYRDADGKHVARSITVERSSKEN